MQKNKGNLHFPEKAIPLEITKPLSNAEVTEGESLTLTCELNKKDVPVKWLKNGKEIKPDDDYVVESDDTEYTLTFPKANFDHEAEYTVKFDDKQSSCEVIVRGESGQHLI